MPFRHGTHAVGAGPAHQHGEGLRCLLGEPVLPDAGVRAARHGDGLAREPLHHVERRRRLVRAEALVEKEWRERKYKLSIDVVLYLPDSTVACAHRSKTFVPLPVG